MVRVVGLSGTFPEAKNAHEFWEHLAGNHDMVTHDDRRWPAGLHGLPTGTGKVPGLDLFDAARYGITPAQADRMDPQLRKLLEGTEEALLDAGVDPEDLRGSNTAVHVGMCFSDSHTALVKDAGDVVGYENTGCAHAMMANRISFQYDFHGPSEVHDTACSSSMVALDRAVRDLVSGRCEWAVVGGSSATLWPNINLAFQKLSMLSPDGACKTFDQSANGYARSEAVVVLLLTTSDVPTTDYGRVLGTGINSDGYTERGITFPSADAQEKLYRQVCGDANVDPTSIQYIEAHGTGTVAGDGQELTSLAAHYGAGDQPTLIGSVKSNMGHSEGASALCGLVKVLLAAEHRLLPANLHFQQAPESSTALHDGTFQVVHTNTPWRGGKATVSSFGFGGTNGHAIVDARRNTGTIRKPFSRSAPVHFGTGRSAQSLFEGVEDMEHLAWLEGSTAKLKKRPRVAKHLTGYVEAEKLPSDHPAKVCFVFTGQGCQWPAMARDLLNTLPAKSPFVEALKLCEHELMRRNSPGLLEMLKNGDPQLLHPRWSGIAITALQIALVDLLRLEYHLTPNYVLGHSIGEVAAGYADQSTSLKQTIAISLYRSLNTKHLAKDGLMAAVGLDRATAEAKVKDLPNVVVACHNSPTGVTLSGPATELAPLLDQLKEEDVFVRKVETGGVAYHNPTVLPLERKEAFLTKMKEDILPDPKYRSLTWFSSSSNGRLNDASYHTENLIGTVEFVKALNQVPEGTVLLEVGPAAILQSVLRRTRPDLVRVGLMKKNESPSETISLGLAQLWIHNVPLLTQPKPDHAAPLAIRTRLGAWDHSTSWRVVSWQEFGASGQGTKVVLTRDEIGGHCIDGRVLVPAAGYIEAAWRALDADQPQGTRTPRTFYDVEILQAVVLEPDEDETVLVVQLFEDRWIIKNPTGDVVAQGKVKDPVELPDVQATVDQDPTSFYNIIATRGYEYQDQFRVVASINDAGTQGSINPPSQAGWSAFLDGLLQVQLPWETDETGLALPTTIREITVRPEKATSSSVPFQGNPYTKEVTTALAQVKGLVVSPAPRQKVETAVEQVQFLPYNTLIQTQNHLELALSTACEHCVGYPLCIQGNNEEQIEQAKELATKWMHEVVPSPDEESKTILFTDEEGQNADVTIYQGPAPTTKGQVQLVDENNQETHVYFTLPTSSTEFNVTHDLNPAELYQLVQSNTPVLLHGDGAPGLYRALRKEGYLNTVLKQDGIYGRKTILKNEKGFTKLNQEVCLDFTEYGNLDSATWIPAPTDAGSCHVKVNTATLNFKDVMLAYGKLDKKFACGWSQGGIGFEMAGTTTQGRKVMGFARHAIATDVYTREDLLWDVPASWSLEEAATVPTVYATAYYALIMRGNLQAGDRVLIHAGTGGVGQAAIRIALQAGAEVFTTCGSEKKIQFLLDTFGPLGLSLNHIGHSRSTSFEQTVMNGTSGNGCDVILNSLAGDKLQASLRCLAPHGRFLEIGKADIQAETPVLMGHFLRNTSFCGIDLDQVMDAPRQWARLRAIMQAGIESGTVTPLPKTLYPVDQVADAMRFLASGGHIGKVLVVMRDSDPNQLKQTNRFNLDPVSTYLVTGGLGGLGVSLVERLVQRGAKTVVVTSRSGIRTQRQRRLQAYCTAHGCKLVVETRDLSDPETCQLVVTELVEQHLDGVFCLAGVLRDGLLEKATHADWKTVMNSKVTSTYNLDQALRQQNLNPTYFLTASSVSAGFGNAGQTNYAAANSSLDQLVEARVRDQLNAVSVQFGVLAVGMGQGKVNASLGTLASLPVQQCLDAVEQLSVQGVTSVYGVNLHEEAGDDVPLPDRVASMLGVKLAAMQDDATLATLGMDSLLSSQASRLIFKTKKIKMSAVNVSKLTVAELKAL